MFIVIAVFFQFMVESECGAFVLNINVYELCFKQISFNKKKKYIFLKHKQFKGNPTKQILYFTFYNYVLLIVGI